MSLIVVAPKTLYLVSLNDGELYESQGNAPLFLTTTRAHAERILIEVDKWLAKQRDRVPEEPELDGYASDDLWSLAYAKWEKHFARLRPPYGLTDLIGNLRYGKSAYLVITVMTVKRDPTETITSV